MNISRAQRLVLRNLRDLKPAGEGFPVRADAAGNLQRTLEALRDKELIGADGRPTKAAFNYLRRYD